MIRRIVDGGFVGFVIENWVDLTEWND